MRSLALVVMMGSASAPAIAAPAPGQPRMQPLLAMPGVALPGTVQGTTFCDASQRAIVRIDDGKIVAIDAAGSLTHLGNAGLVPHGAAMACDRADRVWIANGKSLVVIAPGQPPQDAVGAAAGKIDHLRVLDDGTLGVVALGAVYQHDGTKLEPRWTAGPAAVPPYQLDGTGQRLVAMSRGRAVVLAAAGLVEGPSAHAATWLDNTTLLVADLTGKLARWSIDQPRDLTRTVGQVPRRPQRAFVRVRLHRGSARRVVVETDTDGLLALGFAADGELAASALISRVPGRRSGVAVGDAPFGVVAVNGRALVIPDLATPAFLVDHAHPLLPIDTMAFSPDGRTLALLGGDKDVLLVPIDPRLPPRRLVAPTASRSPLQWFPDGTLRAGFLGFQLWWTPDGHVEDRRDSVVGFTDLGQPVRFDEDLHALRFDRGTAPQRFPLARTFRPFRADVIGRRVLARGLREARLYELGVDAPRVVATVTGRAIRDAWLVGDAAILTLDDRHGVGLHDGTMERSVAAFAKQPVIAVSPDRTRFALASDTEVALYDARGTRFDLLGRRARAMAWSPDGRTLALATAEGVELWTFPR